MERIIIIGGGIIGCFLAHDLSKYEVQVTLIERNADICDEVSSANSAIVHAGYDPKDGTLKALLNKRGADMYPDVCKALHVDYQPCGAYVVACGKEEEMTLRELKQRGQSRGIEMIWMSQQELRKEEPNLSKEITAGLSVPKTAIITPWEVGLGLIQGAVLNGAKLKLSENVTGIQKEEDHYCVTTSKGEYEADIIINAAGLGSQRIMEMVEDTSLFQIKPKRGQYYILSKHASDFVKHILYPVPGPTGKGVLCVPTCHGNILLGPNSEWLEEEDNGTSSEGLAEVKTKLQKTLINVPYHEVIHSYSGLRPCGNDDDFFIQHSLKDANIIHLGCIDSPGLASAPAISEYVIQKMLMPLHHWQKKMMVHHHRMGIRMKDLSMEERQKLIQEKPAYGHIICRCEEISEQEVVNCIHEPCGARTIKEIKKRVRPGMGKCQGGFCEIEVAKILARELKIPLKDVRYDKTSYFMENKGVKK